MSPAPGRVALAAFVAVAVFAGVAVAAVAEFREGATTGQLADRVDPPAGDVVSLYDVQTVDQFVVDGSFAIARQIGAVAAVGRTGSVGMQQMTRNGTAVHSPPAGYLIPMAFIALPREAVRGVVGDEVSSVLGSSTVVINEMTALQTGAQVGDVMDLRAQDGSTQSFRVAGIRPYTEVGGSDLVITLPAADRIGVHDDTRTVIWGIRSRPAFESALAANGLSDRLNTRVARSWDPPDPDDTLSTPRAKQALGEPWYRVTGTDTIDMHPDWKARNLTDGRVVLNSSIPIRAQCHLEIVDDLSAALADVAAAGLGGAFDLANTNTYGGCYNPRYSRTSGFLSRHAYAMALDANTVTNCQGCVPQMNCDVVRIFRRHGFAWGGNFRQPDGMHFEWVGTPRHQISYPSKYCPNLVNTAGEGMLTQPPMGNEVLTAGMEWMAFGDDH
jgi:hypothetical protein